MIESPTAVTQTKRARERAAHRRITCGYTSAKVGRILARCLFLTALLGNATSTSARILKTRTKSPAQVREVTLTFGSSFEYESDGEQSELGLPFLAEYGLTKALTLTIEPKFVFLHARDATALNGLDDLETSATYALLVETPSRPGCAATAIVKWPTAAHAEFGTGKADYTLGILLSKSLGGVDLDLNATYTFVGSPANVPLTNANELSLAAEYDLTSRLDLLIEILTVAGGSPAASTQGGREIEGTLGIAEQLAEHLKLEEGVILRSGGERQLAVGWEWDFGGE
jgi:hypothetical protein